MALDQPKSTFTDTTPHKRYVTDYISLIDPDDTPFLTHIGPNSAEKKFNFVNLPGYYVEWLEDTYRAYTGATLTATVTSTGTTLSVSDASYFKVGDVLLIGDEKLWVSAITAATEALTVARGHEGTTNASHATGSVTILYQSRLEGADSDEGPVQDITSNSNYIQIFHKGLKITDVQNKIQQYGIAREFDYQSEKGIPEMMRDVERMVFYGGRTAGSATSPRGSGGLATFVTDNTFTTSAANLTIGNVESFVYSIFADGGKPNLIVCSPLRVLTLQNLYHNTGFVRITTDEDTIGMNIGKFKTPFGIMTVLMDRWCPDADLWFLTDEHVGMYEFDAPAWKPLATSGSYERAQLESIYSLCVKHDKAHGRLVLS